MMDLVTPTFCGISGCFHAWYMKSSDCPSWTCLNRHPGRRKILAFLGWYHPLLHCYIATSLHWHPIICGVQTSHVQGMLHAAKCWITYANVCIYRRHINAFIPLIDFPCISVDIFSAVHLPQNGLWNLSGSTTTTTTTTTNTHYKKLVFTTSPESHKTFLASIHYNKAEPTNANRQEAQCLKFGNW